MTDNPPPPHPTKHELEGAAAPPAAKKLKAGTLDGFLTRLKPSPAKATPLSPKDTNTEPKPPAGVVAATATDTVSTASTAELGAASQPHAAGAVAAAVPPKARTADASNASGSPKTAAVSGTAPSTVPAVASAGGFDAQAWLLSLPAGASRPSTRDLLALEAATLDPTWLGLLKGELTKAYFLGLKRFLWSHGVEGTESSTAKVYPPANDIYAWSRYTPLTKVRVVIIGQDPYHGPGQAHGLCFSVRPGTKIPPSLRNIYKEIGLENAGWVAPKHGSLISWAQHGVLLLNTSLTVEPGKAGSHAGKGWETLTDQVITLVDKYGGSGEEGRPSEGVVFLAWGAWAAKRVDKLNKTKHLVLKSAHPSPLSASRGFIGNNHFKQCNEWLERKYGPEGTIPWTEVDEKAA